MAVPPGPLWENVGFPVNLVGVQEILIGDVQGCAREFRKTVERARLQFGDQYKLSQVGDLVNKGPDNLAALEIMREEMEAGRGDFVLGNHEIHLIRVLAGLAPLFPGDTLQDVVGSAESEEWLHWLRVQKIAVSRILAGDPALVVHASVHPHWTLEDCLRRAGAIEASLGSDEESVWTALVSPRLNTRDLSVATLRDDLARFTTCRSVAPEDPGHWSSSEPAGIASTAWHAVWRLHQHPYGVVYGHWARQGLVVAPGLRGLDTGCVYSHLASSPSAHQGCLTAWLPQSPSVATLGTLPVFAGRHDSLWNEAPPGPYLSGSERYSFRPQSTPRGFERPHRAIVDGGLTTDEDEIVVVSGLPRSGTSLWMQMLKVGGMPVLTDEIRRPDEDNPRGYLELEAVKRIREDSRWLERAKGHAVKVVAPLLCDLPSQFRYAVIFSQRDLAEISSSQTVMLKRRGQESHANPELTDAFAHALAHAVNWVQESPNVRALFLDYPEVLRDPFEAAVSVTGFLSAELDPGAMARAVVPHLYRQSHSTVQ